MASDAVMTHLFFLSFFLKERFKVLSSLRYKKYHNSTKLNLLIFLIYVSENVNKNSLLVMYASIINYNKVS